MQNVQFKVPHILFSVGTYPHNNEVAAETEICGQEWSTMAQYKINFGYSQELPYLFFNWIKNVF